MNHRRLSNALAGLLLGLCVTVPMLSAGTEAGADPAIAAAPADVFRVQRLSPRVLLLTENSPMENIMIALAGRDGLVVVDTFGSPLTAEAARRVIESEFKRSDFKYVVNTHPHWDHAWGNQVFGGARVVGYRRAKRDAAAIESGAARMGAQYRREIPGLERTLAAAPVAEQRAVRQRLAAYRRLAGGLETGFHLVPPDITFTDRESLELGDLTLQLVFFGRAHSGEDVFVHVPEEQLLLTGDVFLDRGWMPLFSGQGDLDIPRWIEVLDALLAQKLTVVVPGHRQPWTPATLQLWRDYIADLWAGVGVAREEGLDLMAAKRRLGVPGSILYLKTLGHADDAIRRFHERNVDAFWRQRLRLSAATRTTPTAVPNPLPAPSP